MESINSKQFEEILNSGEPVLVDFYADWCGPCKMLTPILDKVSNSYENVKFVKIDVDNERELSAQLGIKSLPTIALFKDGKAIDAFVGFKPEQPIREFLNKHI